MSKRRRKRKCCNCRELYMPCPSSRHHQTYCSKPECQRARKAKNNRDFRERNPDYFKDPIHAQRVKAWRQDNPGYWRGEKRHGGPGRATVSRGPQNGIALQAVSVPQAIEHQVDQLKLKVEALQAVSNRQQLTFQGFASQLTGTALQADIGLVLTSWYDRGSRLGNVLQAAVEQNGTGGEHETDEATVSSRSPSEEAHPGAVQLGGPASGA